MTEYLLLFVSAALVTPAVVERAFATRGAEALPDGRETAQELALATGLVLIPSAVLAYLLDTLLLQPMGLGYLRALLMILVIAALALLTERALRRYRPGPLADSGLLLPLLTGNGAVLGLALMQRTAHLDFLDALSGGIFGALGFGLILITFTAMRERIAYADIPAPFRGPAILLITAGLTALALLGLTGLVKA